MHAVWRINLTERAQRSAERALRTMPNQAITLDLDGGAPMPNRGEVMLLEDVSKDPFIVFERQFKVSQRGVEVTILVGLPAEWPARSGR